MTTELLIDPAVARQRPSLATRALRRLIGVSRRSPTMMIGAGIILLTKIPFSLFLK